MAPGESTEQVATVLGTPASQAWIVPASAVTVVALIPNFAQWE